MTLAFLKSPLGENPVVSEAVYRVPPKRVFRAWTEPEEIRSWFGHEPFCLERVELDLRPGGEWMFVFKGASFRAVRGEYLEVVPNALLVFTWRHEGTKDGGTVEVSPMSKVTVRFASRGAGTILTIVHEDIADTTARRNVSQGWSRALQSLTDRLGPQ